LLQLLVLEGQGGLHLLDPLGSQIKGRRHLVMFVSQILVTCHLSFQDDHAAVGDVGFDSQAIHSENVVLHQFTVLHIGHKTGLTKKADETWVVIS
jgi:hypothetical protein